MIAIAATAVICTVVGLAAGAWLAGQRGPSRRERQTRACALLYLQCYQDRAEARVADDMARANGGFATAFPVEVLESALCLIPELRRETTAGEPQPLLPDAPPF